MLFKFLYHNLEGYRLRVFGAILVTVTQVACDILTAYPIKWVIGVVSNPGNDPACTFSFLNPILSWFDNPVLDPSLRLGPPPQTQCPIAPSNTTATVMATQHSQIGVIVFSILALIMLGSASAILSYLDLYLAGFIGQNLSARLRNRLFDHLQRLSLDWHGKHKKGDLVQRITGNIADIEKLVTDGLVDLLAGILTLIGVFAIMLSMSWQYTLIALAIVPALAMIVLSYTTNIKAATKKATKATGQVADVATEDINALTVIKVFTREERESSRFGAYVDTTRRAGLRARGLQAQFTPLVAVLSVFGTAAVVGVGGYVAAGYSFSLGPLTIAAYAVDVGTLVVFMKFLGQMYQPMRDLSKLTTLWTTASSGAERIDEVFAQAPEVVETQTPYYGPTKLRGDIVFDHVTFGYVPERPVLKGIDLHIEPGKKVGLVGLSGGGKTTLVKLIPRFYEIQGGSVRIDGADNRLYPLSVLRQNVSMVLQDSVLFEGTIRDNVAIGRPGASDEEIVEAAKQANIHDVIMRDLGGYDRVVREQGKDLSGGQRQRMAIARAILRDAPILILDEPTAALDVEAEAEVMHALSKLIVGRTVLMISHRLSSLGNVDEIIVLKDGQIAEQGSFAELKRKRGVFAALLDEQNRYNADRVAEKTVVRSRFAPLLEREEEEDAPLPRTARGGPKPAEAVPAIPVRPATPAAQAPLAAEGLPRKPAVPVSVPVAVARKPVQRQQPEPQTDLSATHAAVLACASVIIEVDSKVVGEHSLDKPLLTVGRRSNSDVMVPSDVVSRLHARIREVEGGWQIEDAESLNGLVYQGHRVDKLSLNDGDRVYLAPSVVLQFKAGA